MTDLNTSEIKHYALSALSLFFFPVIALAQNGGELSTLQSLVNNLGGVVNSAIPVAAGLALLGFFFGLAKYIFQAGNDEAQQDAKDIMVWGGIALFLVAAIGGIIAALEATLGLNSNAGVDPSNFEGNIPNGS